ncbi:MAG TPA: hypothetical protein VGK20_08105, partial [Candidatus Binatia bacterium]
MDAGPGGAKSHVARRLLWQQRLERLAAGDGLSVASPEEEGDRKRTAEEKEMEDKTDALKLMVLLSPDGTVLSAKGTDTDEFSAVAAYATQLAQRLGEGLGL